MQYSSKTQNKIKRIKDIFQLALDINYIKVNIVYIISQNI